MKTITKRCGNVDKKKKYFAKLKTMVFFFLEKNLNEEDGVVIKTWLWLINEINS